MTLVSMDNISVEKSIKDFCDYMDLAEIDFRKRPIANPEELKNRIVEELKENPVVLGKFLFVIFDLKTRRALVNNLNIERKLEGSTPLKEIFRKTDVRINFEKLESSTGLVFPALMVPSYKYFIQLCLYVIPIIIIVAVILTNMEFFAANFFILKWAIVTPFIFVPSLVFYIFFPNFFKPSILPNDNSYGELVSELVTLNRQFYTDKNWENTYSEIATFLKSIAVIKQQAESGNEGDK